MQHLKKPWVGGTLANSERLARIGHDDSPSYSSSFFSHPCALFCASLQILATPKDSSLLFSCASVLLHKTLGVEYPHGSHRSLQFAFSLRPSNSEHCISPCEVPPCLKPSSSPPFALPSAAPTKARSAPRAPTISPLSPSRKRSPAFPASTPRKLTT